MNEKTVTHPGIIKNVEQGKAEVLVIANSACGTCEIKGACSSSESEEKIIQIDLLPGQQYQTGQSVVVEMKQSIGNWAVLLGYIFPFVAVFLGLILFISIGMDEGIAGILSLVTLALYYYLLFSFRNLISKKFTYGIKP